MSDLQRMQASIAVLVAAFMKRNAGQYFGPKGDKGEDGKDGRDGRNGRDGKDGKDGINGVDGLQGLRGPKGDKGDKGEQGEPGVPGKDAEFDEDDLERFVRRRIVTFGGNNQTGGATLKTNGVNNPNQSIFNLVNGGKIAFSSAADGSVTAGWTGLTANALVLSDGTDLTQDATNLLYTTASGPRLQVGSGSTTNAGMIVGYSGFSSIGAVWNAALASPSTNNMALMQTPDGSTYLQSATGQAIQIRVGGGNKVLISASAGEGPAITAGTAATNVNALSATQTWNAAGVAFTGIKFVATTTASAAGSLLLDLQSGTSGNEASVFSVRKDGVTTILGTQLAIGPAGAGRSYFNNTAGWSMGSGINFGWSNNTDAAVGALDTNLSRVGANQVAFAGGTVGGGVATSRAEINKAVTAFTDAVAKTVFTLTIPNAAHSASYLVRLTGSIGAGGAVGANEASATNCYVVTLTRTAGVNAVATISAAFGAAASNVAGATTVTCTGALGAVGGAVNASNTITIDATITKAGGASDNHTCVATASLLNANATGVTIS